MTSPERPGCATTIRSAAGESTAVRLLALPVEPPVGSEVEVRSVDGYREGAWFRGPQSDENRPWTPTHTPYAPAIGRASWRSLCEHTVRYRGCELWLTREGPLDTDTEEGT